MYTFYIPKCDMRFCMPGTQVGKVPSTRWGSRVSLVINIHGTWLCIILPLCVLKLSANCNISNTSWGLLETWKTRICPLDIVQSLNEVNEAFQEIMLHQGAPFLWNPQCGCQLCKDAQAWASLSKLQERLHRARNEVGVRGEYQPE